MVSVVDDLKRKLAEVDTRLVAIREEAAALEGQKAAFETVIAVYDPSFNRHRAEAVQRRQIDTR